MGTVEALTALFAILAIIIMSLVFALMIAVFICFVTELVFTAFDWLYQAFRRLRSR